MQHVIFSVMAHENSHQVNNDKLANDAIVATTLSRFGCLFTWKTILVIARKFYILDERIMAFRPLDHYIIQKCTQSDWLAVCPPDW